MPKCLSCWLLAGGPSPSSEATSSAGALQSQSQSPAVVLHGGPGIDGHRQADPALECASENTESPWFQNTPSAGKLHISYSQSYPRPSSLLLITTQEVPFPPVKMVITFFSLGVDIFFESPRALTRAHESHFNRGKSLSSRLDKTEVQT